MDPGAGVGPVFAFASALAGVAPTVYSLYSYANASVATAVIINVLYTLQTQNNSIYSYSSNLGQVSAMQTTNNQISTSYNTIQNLTIAFLNLAATNFANQAEKAALQAKTNPPPYGIGGTSFSSLTISAAAGNNLITSFIANCQAATPLQNCQTAAAYYAINLIQYQIMGHILQLWGGYDFKATLDLIFSTIVTQVPRVEAQIGSYYISSANYVWSQPNIVNGTAFASFGGNLFSIFFSGSGTTLNVVRGQISNQANPTNMWTKYTYATTTVPSSPSSLVQPSLVGLGSLLHLLFLGVDNNLYYYTFNPTSGTWTQNVTVAATVPFPGFNANDGGYSTSILQLNAAGGNLYLVGVAPNKGVLVHTVVNILAGNYAAYASGLGDASWGHPQYYRTFQTLDLDGNLYLFGRGATGLIVAQVSTTSYNYIITLGQFANSNSFGWENNVNRYSTIRAIYAGGDLIVCGRSAEGVYTLVMKQFLSNPSGTPETVNITAWSDTAGFGVSAYETIRTYTANNAAYIAVFDSTRWQTCAFYFNISNNLKPQWDCSTNNNLNISAVSSNIRPYYGVVSYDWQYGTIPFFYYTYPTATYPTQINIYPGNPFPVVNNFNSSRMVYTPVINFGP